MPKSATRSSRQPVTGHVLAQLREFFRVPRNWGWALLPAAAGGAGAMVLSVYRPGGRGPGLAGTAVCLGLALGLWGVYSVLVTVPTLLCGSRIAAALRKDALTFIPLTVGLLLAAGAAYGLRQDPDNLLAGAWAESATVLFVWAVGMKLFFVPGDLSAMTRWLTGRCARRVMILTVLAGTGSIAVAAVWRHAQFLTFTSDLGIMDQTVWNTAHGRLLMFSRGLTQLTSRPLTGRVELPFLVLAPFYRLWADPRLLQVAQAAVLGLGAVPLFLVARRRFGGEAPAVVMAVVFVLQPALQGIGLAAVHTNAFAVPLILAAFLSLDADRPRAFWWWSVAALGCREDVMLMTAPLGVYAAFRPSPSHRKAGLGVFLVSVGWLAVLKGLLPRWFGPAPVLGGVTEVKMIGLLSGGFGHMASQLAHHPTLLFTQLLDPANGLYLAQLLVPWALLPLLAPRFLLVALPGLYLNMITGWGQMNDVHSQYQAYVVPLLAVAAVLGAAGLTARIQRWGQAHAWARMNEIRSGNALPAVLVVLLVAAGFGRLAFGTPTRPHPPWNAAHRAALYEAVELVPAAASVTAPQHVGAHLSQRDELLLFCDRAPLGDYVIWDGNEFLLWQAPKASRDELGLHWAYPPDLLARPDYGVIFCRQGVLVLKRGASHEAGLRRVLVRPRLPAGPQVTCAGGTVTVRKRGDWSGKTAGALDLELTWRPPPDRRPFTGQLVVRAGGKETSLDWVPAQGLVAADRLADTECLADRLYVCVGNNLAGPVQVTLRAGGGETLLGRFPLRR